MIITILNDDDNNYNNNNNDNNNENFINLFSNIHTTVNLTFAGKIYNWLLETTNIL